LGSTEPATEINKFGYNPALERRIKFQQVPNFHDPKETITVNINYMYDHPDFETAYRCNVEKAGNTAKLALRPKEDPIREEHFVMVETSYREMRQIMLAKKFEGNYQDSLPDGDDEGGKDRISTIVAEETGRREKIMANKSLS
jgi:hypothetical protein